MRRTRLSSNLIAALLLTFRPCIAQDGADDYDAVIPLDFLPNFPNHEPIPFSPPRPDFFPPDNNDVEWPSAMEIWQDLVEDALDDPRTLPAPPVHPSHEGYEIDCSGGKLPPARLFPPGRNRKAYSSLTELCSIYTDNSIPHLGCQCRNPGLGDWIICHGPPWGDSALSSEPLPLQATDPANWEQNSIVDHCYKHCRCRAQVPRLPPSESSIDSGTVFDPSNSGSGEWTPLKNRDQSFQSVGPSVGGFRLVMAKSNMNIVIQQSISYLPSRAVAERLIAAGVTPRGGWACAMSGGWNGTCPRRKLRPKPKNPSSGSASGAAQAPRPAPVIPGVPPEDQPDRAPQCRATCDVKRRFWCGSGCKCVASSVSSGLSHVAGCMARASVQRLLSGEKPERSLPSVRYGGSLFAGTWGGRRKRSVDEEEKPLVRWGCPCNGSYVSAGCCESADGIVYERLEDGLGKLNL